MKKSSSEQIVDRIHSYKFSEKKKYCEIAGELGYSSAYFSNLMNNKKQMVKKTIQRINWFLEQKEKELNKKF